MKKTLNILFMIVLSIALIYIIFKYVVFFNKIDKLEANTKWVQSNERIYFFKNDDVSRNSIYSIMLNGEGLKKVISGPVNYLLLSPDGRKIAYLLDGSADSNHVNLWNGGCGIYDINSESVFKISDKARDIDWDPSSTEVTFNKDDHSISIFDMKDMSQKDMIRIPDDIIVGPRWSIDGRNLFFNTLFSKCYYELNVDTKIINKLKSNPTDSTDRINSKQDMWINYIDISKMHVNQSSVSGVTYDDKLSPSGKDRLSNKNGSLVLVKSNKSDETIIIHYVGYYNPDFGYFGITKPAWTKDERYALGDFNNNIIVVDIVTKRSGILTNGHSPISYLPNYRPERFQTDPMYYRFLN